MQVSATPGVRERREALVREHMKSENRHEFDVTLSTFDHPRYEIVPTGDVFDGPEEVRRYFEDTRAAFPDQRNELIALHHADEGVIVEFDLKGTHKGPLRGIPPTGMEFSCRTAAFFLFEGDRLVCERVYFDAATILGQLGVLAPGPVLRNDRSEGSEAHPHEQLIERFYSAFDAGDGETMAACYSPDVRFSDPVFPDLEGVRAGDMWKMLAAGKEESRLRVELLEREADDERGSARWRAHYTFTETGRAVVNDIQAGFRFEGDRIAEHRDHFDFHRWARQALGPVGLLLGWTPIVRSAVRRKAAARLEQFERAGGSSGAPGP